MGMIRNILGGLTIAACLGATAVSGETVIYYGHSGPDRGTVPAALKWYNSRIGELSAGDLRMDVQWGGALFKASAAVQGISDGVADAGSIIAAYFQKEMAAYSLADFPIGGPNAWVAMRAADRLMRSEPQITEHLARQNLVYIGTFTASAVNVACAGEPIRSVEDIKGKKVRGAGVYGKVFGEMGATRVNLSVYEAYQGLDTGLIDCSQGYDYIVPSLKWDEVIDSYTVLNWGQIGGYGMFMNKQVFDGLEAGQQQVLMQAGEELADQFAKIVTGANSKAMKAMTAGETSRKIEVIELSAADKSALNAAAEPFIADWMENARSVGLDADRLMATYTAAVAEFTSEFEAKGYPWTRSN
ncbi:C4-dicarboxylate TRAP transporter substrate-binding protein [Leisingera sp. M527]|uniref:C4-dicarboxylate TRAP transporter substrate-binding protein n=1 Tax=Leisingera sp. M527 TaxID=2867014 RepID=UPI0021A81184|nr:C4-dicarboxylate TRAP transporter substrate-binding protein [Leisingera sp. M527]UWQ32359.1 C4-dicarboxylate TRAP transporter substrate-binding protein [Leisingera sp. M527]